MPPPPHHVEMWRNVEGFHTSRTENITLKSPQDGLICAGTQAAHVLTPTPRAVQTGF